MRFWVSRVKRLRSPQDQFWAKMQFWSHKSILVYKVGAFVNQKDILGKYYRLSPCIIRTFLHLKLMENIGSGLCTETVRVTPMSDNHTCE